MSAPCPQPDPDPSRIDSLSGSPMPLWMKVFIGAAGVLLLGTAMRGYLTGSGDSLVAKLFVGAACLYALGFDKKMYVADEGIVKETKTWLNRNREVFPWEEVKFVTLAFRGGNMMAFFERGVTGWKLLFRRDQEEPMRALIRRRIPQVEVDTVGKPKAR
ncbi:hypothetical protein [Aminomonas paucivorans]|nr:hypothetical protein [Aminomonas paucivorans]